MNPHYPISATTMFNLKPHWIEQYQKAKALWIHSGDPRQPHALLTSGEHSDGFFNSRLIIADRALMHAAAMDIIRSFIILHEGNIGSIDGVVGPQTGATLLAELLGKKMGYLADTGCFSASPAKHEENGVKSMVFSPDELALLPGMSVALCEDVITTGGSLSHTAQAAENAGATVLPYVFALVNRSGMSEVDGRKIIALIDQPMPKWHADECPLCKAGSKALRPKDGENWTLLNAKY